MIYVFEDYELDLRLYELRYAGKRVKLEPQVFDILAYLIQHRDRVITKQELLDHLWPDQFISEATLTHRLMQARKAVGDNARLQSVIQTVHGRGYRFIAAVEECSHETPDRTGSPVLSPSENSPHIFSGTHRISRIIQLVGREQELAYLHQWLQQALKGHRQIVFVTGEAGIGKTSLVEAFLEALRRDKGLWIGQGQCIEHYGSGEAYLPVLEALGRLCRDPEKGQAFRAFLSQRAPTWAVQMPWLFRAEDLHTLQRQTAGATRERMLREFVEAVEILTADQPLILVLEDLHWSDYSTVDLINLLARRQELACLLLLGTYRPTEVTRHDHPLQAVKHELQIHQQCAELSLAFLPERAVHEYIGARFPGAMLSAELPPFIYQRTGGNPLFMVNILDYWVTKGLLVRQGQQWSRQSELEELIRAVPENLRQLIEQQLDQLTLEEQRVVEAGSVAGVKFSAAAVAATLEREVVQIEECCKDLVRRSQLLQPCEEQVWPDGTLVGSYQFVHTLYQEVVYQRIPASRRVQWHQQIGARLEAGYGSLAREVAAELAMHFVRGMDRQRAIRYLQYAGEQALQRSAYQEAMAYLSQALEMLHSLPDTLEHKSFELTLRLSLGNALIATNGFTQEVEDGYRRAWELCQQLGETPQLFPALRGVWAISFQRGKLRIARAHGEEFLRLAQRQQDSAFLLEAYRMLGCTLLSRGEFSLARVHIERGIALYDAQRHRAHAFLYAQDPGVSCLLYQAWILWCLGYPDQALQRSQEALTLAQQLSHPYSLAWAHSFAATLHQLRREAWQTHEQARASVTICSEQGFTFRLARSSILQGWAMVMQGQREKGMALIHQGLTAHQNTGLELGPPYFLTLLAEAYSKETQPDEGLRLLTEALIISDKTGERCWDAELHRLQGELLLQSSVQCPESRVSAFPALRTPDLEAEAEACFHQALTIARHQQAKSWELRAAISLSRLWQHQGKRIEAGQLLSEIYGWFTEGFGTIDLQEAKALLRDLED